MVCVPDPLKERVWGRGRLLTLPIAVVGSIAAVAVWKVWGLVALAGAVLVGMVAELWRDWCSTRATVSDLTNDLTGERTAHANLRDQLEATRSESGELQKENAVLAARVEELQREVEAPQLSVGHLLHAIGSHLAEVEIVERHRELSEELGHGEWAVTSLSRDGQRVTVVAHVAAGANRLGGEPVTLLDKRLGARVADSVVRATNAMSIEVILEPDEVAGFALRRLLRADGQPDHYLIQLAGVSARPFATMDADDLSNYASQLRALAATLAAILVPDDSKEGAAE
jgi:hypothetical protein